MRNRMMAGLTAGAILLATATGARAGEKIAWAKSLGAARMQAKAGHKLIMVDFYTDWCVWCKRLDASVYTDSKVVGLSSQLVSVKVNAEKEGMAAAQKYRVTGFPTLLFLNDAGDVEGRIGGYLPPAQFVSTVQQILQTHKTLPLLEARVRANPGDIPGSLSLLQAYSMAGNTAKASELLTRLEQRMGSNRSALGPAYNTVGDLYQSNQQFGQAIPLFQKAAAASKRPYDQAYAHISTATCYLNSQQYRRAVPELKATIAVPNCPPDLKAQAQTYLSRVQQVMR